RSRDRGASGGEATGGLHHVRRAGRGCRHQRRRCLARRHMSVVANLLLECAPPEGAAALRARLRPGEDEVIRVAVDLSLAGHFETQWLVATAERVLVVAGNIVVAEMSVRDLDAVRIEPIVGGGCLELRCTNDPPLRIVYSAALVETMRAVANGIEQLRQGCSVAVPGTRRGQCGRCGRRLPEPDGVCPMCLRRLAALRRVMAFAIPYRARALVLIVAAAATVLLSLTPPLLTRRLVDDA